jgi:hypothetical protein
MTLNSSGRDGRTLTTDIVLWNGMPDCSAIHRITYMREGLVLFRSHSPEGRTPNGLFITKNDKWPKVWGWILAIPRSTLRLYPNCKPGAMIVYTRFAEEPYAEDQAVDPSWTGPDLPIDFLNVDAIEACFDPALVPVQI